MFDLKHKSPNSYVLFVYVFHFISLNSIRQPLNTTNLRYLFFFVLHTLRPLLQKVWFYPLDKLKQRAYDWNQGARGWIYLSSLNNITIFDT